MTDAAANWVSSEHTRRLHSLYTRPRGDARPICIQIRFKLKVVWVGTVLLF